MIEARIANRRSVDAETDAIGADEAGPIQPLDRIFVRDLVREVEIGVHPQEYGVSQRLRFSIEVDVERLPGQVEDDFGQVINYEHLANAIDRIAAGPRVKLLETFAERLAIACLEDARARRVHLRIEKIDILPGGAYFGVEITRERQRS